MECVRSKMNATIVSSSMDMQPGLQTYIIIQSTAGPSYYREECKRYFTKKIEPQLLQRRVQALFHKED